jgi:hypothetical protein
MPAAAPAISVLAYFGIDSTSSVFILDDATRGILDGATYTLGGDVGIDISGSTRVGSITRGRSRALDEFQAGVADITLDNRSRLYDPSYAAGTYFGKIKPGTHVTIQAAGVSIFDGLIDDWDFNYPLDTDSTASFDVVDCLATLGSAEFDAWTTTASQTVGQRLTSILNRPEVNFPATRNIDTGTSTLQADLVSWGSNVLNYAQLVAKCDLGQLFAAKDGTLTFYGRNRVVTGIGAPEFRDDSVNGSIPYSAIEVDYGTELLFNRVSVDATGFTKQTVTDSASFAAFNKWWSLSLAGLPLETQAQALDLANYLLNLYSFPASRFASITVLLHGLEAIQQATVLSLDIGSVIRVVYTPNKVSVPIDKYCMIEGVSHEMYPAYHAVTLRLSNLADGFGGHPFILDDASFGLLDTATSGRLAF